MQASAEKAHERKTPACFAVFQLRHNTAELREDLPERSFWLLAPLASADEESAKAASFRADSGEFRGTCDLRVS